MTLDHITFRTANLAATKVFFETLFDLVEKPRPQAIRHIPGHWLYAEDEPVVHLISSHGHSVGSLRVSADDLAQGYLFAIDNPFVTGAVIDIDGGSLIN